MGECAQALNVMIHQMANMTIANTLQNVWANIFNGFASAGQPIYVLVPKFMLHFYDKNWPKNQEYCAMSKRNKVFSLILAFFHFNGYFPVFSEVFFPQKIPW